MVDEPAIRSELEDRVVAVVADEKETLAVHRERRTLNHVFGHLGDDVRKDALDLAVGVDERHVIHPARLQQGDHSAAGPRGDGEIVGAVRRRHFPQRFQSAGVVAEQLGSRDDEEGAATFEGKRAEPVGLYVDQGVELAVGAEPLNAPQLQSAV